MEAMEGNRRVAAYWPPAGNAHHFTPILKKKSPPTPPLPQHLPLSPNVHLKCSSFQIKPSSHFAAGAKRTTEHVEQTFKHRLDINFHF